MSNPNFARSSQVEGGQGSGSSEPLELKSMSVGDYNFVVDGNGNLAIDHPNFSSPVLLNDDGTMEPTPGTSDGEAATVGQVESQESNPTGTSSGDLNGETGFVDPPGGQSTGTISLNNAYLEGIADVGFSGTLGGSDIVGVVNYNTNADNEITSFDYQCNSDGDEETIEWKFFGVIA